MARKKSRKRKSRKPRKRSYSVASDVRQWYFGTPKRRKKESAAKVVRSSLY